MSSIPRPPAKARAPRRAGLFTQVPKNLGNRLRRRGCSLQEIGLYFTMYTSAETSALGYIYRQHEWAEIAGCNPDSISLYLQSLESKELIIVDGPAILISDYMPDQAFNQPKYLKSGLWDLQRALADKHLLRFIIGVQLLGLNVAAMVGTKAESVRAAAQSIWGEITDDQLPPARYLHGNLDEPDRRMVDSLARMPAADAVRIELDRRQWLGVPEPLRDPLRAAFDALEPTVTPLRSRTKAGG